MAKKLRYDEIPKLIAASDPISMSLSHLEEQLLSFAEDYGIDINPDFQRGHVWTNEQQIRFMEFVLRGGKAPPLVFNSPVFYGKTHKPGTCDLPDTVVLVDGKQRLTAYLDFVRNKLPVFDGYYMKDFVDPVVLGRRTWITYQRNCLGTRAELLQWYLELNEGAVAHDPKELERVRKLLAKEMK